MDIVHTITLEVLAYGPPPSIAKIRKVLGDLLAEEAGPLGDDELAQLVREDAAAAVADDLRQGLLDGDVKLPPSGGKRIGLRMTMPDLNERITQLTLQELVVAKTAACTCTWHSPNDGRTHQVGWVQGERTEGGT